MITREDVHRLEKNCCAEGIVSLYLRVEMNLMSEPDQMQVRFKSMSARYLGEPEHERWAAALEREKGRILKFLDGWIVKGRTLVIFAATPINLWEVYVLDVPIPTALAVDTTPRTKLLLQVLDEYPRFVAAVVQRDQASIYVTEQRQSDKRTEIESKVQGWHSQGGWAQARFQRHIEYQVNEHLKKVVEDLEKMFYAPPSFTGLAIGGTEETAKELIKMLPDPIVRRVIGIFPVDSKHETEQEILDKAQAVFVKNERRTEKALVDQVINLARAGGQGVIGIDATLPTILAGRVQTLVIAEGATKEGSYCMKCDYLSTHTYERCPACGAEAGKTNDIVDRAAEKAFHSGAQVETIFGEARTSLLAQGGMGALLRY